MFVCCPFADAEPLLFPPPAFAGRRQREFATLVEQESKREELRKQREEGDEGKLWCARLGLLLIVSAFVAANYEAYRAELEANVQQLLVIRQRNSDEFKSERKESTSTTFESKTKTAEKDRRWGTDQAVAREWYALEERLKTVKPRRLRQPNPECAQWLDIRFGLGCVCVFNFCVRAETYARAQHHFCMRVNIESLKCAFLCVLFNCVCR